jgi:FkbM family methyltransferase
VERRTFLRVASIVRRLPNLPIKLRARAAYPLATADVTGTTIVRVSEEVRLRLDLADWTQRLYSLGETDAERRRIIKRFLPRGGTFVDVGANIGLYSCWAASQVGPRGRVISFEPMPQNVESLRSNIALNRLTNVEVFEVALSDTPGELDLFVPPSHPGGQSGATRSFDPGGWRATDTVPAARLDDLFDGACLDVIKIDVEGSEELVLAGAMSTLTRYRPVLLCEVIEDSSRNIALGLARELDLRVLRVNRTGTLVGVRPGERPAGDLFLIPRER